MLLVRRDPLFPVIGIRPLRKACVFLAPNCLLFWQVYWYLCCFFKPYFHLPCIQLLNTSVLHLVCTNDATWSSEARWLLEPVRLQGDTGDGHTYSFQSRWLTALGTKGVLSCGLCHRSVTYSQLAGNGESIQPGRGGGRGREKILPTWMFSIKELVNCIFLFRLAALQYNEKEFLSDWGNRPDPTDTPVPRQSCSLTPLPSHLPAQKTSPHWNQWEKINFLWM